MEQQFYNDEFEQLIKEKADQFRMYPSRRVWHSLYNNFHPSRRWPSIAISLLLMGSLLTLGYLNTNETGYNGLLKKNNTNKTAQLSTQARTGVTPNVVSIQSSDLIINPDNDALLKSTNSETANAKYIANKSSKANTTKSTVNKKTNKGIETSSTIETVSNYIWSDKIYSDVALNNKSISKDVNTIEIGIETPSSLIENQVIGTSLTNSDFKDLDINAEKELNKEQVKEKASDEKAWIENYAFQNKPSAGKWKGRAAFEFYVTPAVTYRKLSTTSKGSVSPFANSNINHSISQRPGLGLESGMALSYSAAKNVRIKAGLQFNYNNYNIKAGKINHPISTNILLNDVHTGYSYAAARTSTLANTFNSPAAQPVTIQNRTYQISVPIGFAYKLSSSKNVEWFAGATIQPTYVFGGNAYLISSDLRSYISDNSTIRSWNLNLGFETFMSYKLGGYNLQIGPQVRYQTKSTYQKNVAQIEKPYAIGLKLGLLKGF